MDGSIVNWLNGPLLRAVGDYHGYTVHFEPFRRYREKSEYRRADDHARRNSGAMSMAVTRKTQPRDARLLPTAVVGSYAVRSGWSDVKTDYFQRRISSETLEEIHDVAIKAALKDQELHRHRRDHRRRAAPRQHGGPLRGAPRRHRDRPPRQKAYYYDYYEAVVRHPLRSPRCGWPTSSASRGGGPTAR